jgi:hypothetical protein
MGLTIVLEGERGQKFDEVGDPYQILLTLLKASDTTKTCCLRFIDPYGDTIFNYLQMGQFLEELADLRSMVTSAEQQELLTKIESIAQQCKDGAHLYVKIYGD